MGSVCRSIPYYEIDPHKKTELLKKIMFTAWETALVGVVDDPEKEKMTTNLLLMDLEPFSLQDWYYDISTKRFPSYYESPSGDGIIDKGVKFYFQFE